MIENLPKWNQFADLIIVILNESLDKTLEKKELVKKVADVAISKFKLADADINLLYENSGANIFIDRLQWAISFLKKFEYIKQNKISNKENFFH